VNLPESRHLAQRLLAYEPLRARTPSQRSLRLSRLCELRRPLITRGSCRFSLAPFSCSDAGQGGSSSLSTVQVAADGSLKGLDELEPQIDQKEVRDGGAILIAQLIGLLLTFIGEGLTLRLVQDVWPEAAFNVAFPRRRERLSAQDRVIIKKTADRGAGPR